jgi:hypothetical protein
MTRPSMASKNPDIIASVRALRRAARRALDLGLSTGTPVYVIKGGEIIDLTRDVAGTSQRQVAATVRETPAIYKIPGSERSKGVGRMKRMDDHIRKKVRKLGSSKKELDAVLEGATARS